MNETCTYRVIGVRRDGSRIVLDEHLSRARAKAVQLLLIAAGAFPVITIEEEQRPRRPDLAA